MLSYFLCDNFCMVLSEVVHYEFTILYIINSLQLECCGVRGKEDFEKHPAASCCKQSIFLSSSTKGNSTTSRHCLNGVAPAKDIYSKVNTWVIRLICWLWTRLNIFYHEIISLSFQTAELSRVPRSILLNAFASAMTHLHLGLLFHNPALTIAHFLSLSKQCEL